MQWCEEELLVKRNPQGVIIGVQECTPPTIHDERRKQSLLKTLEKAREKAEECWLYLTANDRDPLEISNVAQAMYAIENAMRFLGVEVTES